MTEESSGKVHDDNNDNGHILSDMDIDRFREDGYIHLKQAFSKETAKECVEALWSSDLAGYSKGIIRDDKDTWLERVSIPEAFTEPPFSFSLTTKLIKAIDELLGHKRWKRNTLAAGWWMITFPGFYDNKGEKEKWGAAGHWHIDGPYKHYPHSKEQGLILLMLFTDVKHGDGGTALAVGSHKYGIQTVFNHRERGIVGGNLSREVLRMGGVLNNVIEAVGDAGDAYIIHPLLLHARSKNLGKNPRFLCNPCIHLLEDLDLENGDGLLESLAREYSNNAKEGEEEIEEQTKKRDRDEDLAEMYGLPLSFGNSKKR